MSNFKAADDGLILAVRCTYSWISSMFSQLSRCVASTFQDESSPHFETPELIGRMPEIGGTLSAFRERVDAQKLLELLGMKRLFLCFNISMFCFTLSLQSFVSFKDPSCLLDHHQPPI